MLAGIIGSVLMWIVATFIGWAYTRRRGLEWQDTRDLGAPFTINVKFSRIMAVIIGVMSLCFAEYFFIVVIFQRLVSTQIAIIVILIQLFFIANSIVNFISKKSSDNIFESDIDRLMYCNSIPTLLATIFNAIPLIIIGYLICNHIGITLISVIYGIMVILALIGSVHHHRSILKWNQFVDEMREKEIKHDR